jgi:hypothetical protein
MDSLSERVTRLEDRCYNLDRQVRRWKLAGASALACCAALVLSGAHSQNVAKTIEAEQFVLRDKDGKRRAVLEVNAKGDTVLQLSDRGEKSRINLIVAEDGSPIVSLQDQKDQPRVSLSVPASINGSVLNLVDPNGQVRLGMGVRKDGVPTLDLRDKDANRRINLGVMPDGSGTLHFFGADESQRIRMGLGRDLPTLLFFDQQKSPRLGMVVSPTGLVGLDVFGREKRMRLASEPDGRMSLRITDAQGKVIFQIPER